jgi:ABC-type molybdate transport system permease subunit
VLEQVILASGEVVNELIFPPIVFGLIALGAFGALGAITYSYRNVANRHRTKVSSSSSAGHH